MPTALSHEHPGPKQEPDRPAWASLRSPLLLGIFFGVGFLAGTLAFALSLGLGPLPIVPGLNGVGFALVVLLACVLELALWARNFRLGFLTTGLSVGMMGLLASAIFSRLLFFAIHGGAET